MSWLEDTFGPNAWIVGYPIGMLLAFASVMAFRLVARIMR